MDGALLCARHGVSAGDEIDMFLTLGIYNLVCGGRGKMGEAGTETEATVVMSWREDM